MRACFLLAAGLATSTSLADVARAQVSCGSAESFSLLSGASAATACAVTNTLTTTVPSAAKLSIGGVNAVTTPLTAPRAADFGVGGSGNRVTTAGPSLGVSSNVAYVLTAQAPQFFTPTTQGASATKPASDVTIAVTATINGTMGAPTPYNTIGAIGSGAATNGDTFALSYGTRYNWTVDKPGGYSLVVTFTLTAP